jgi:hypothetical protein
MRIEMRSAGVIGFAALIGVAGCSGPQIAEEDGDPSALTARQAPNADCSTPPPALGQDVMGAYVQNGVVEPNVQSWFLDADLARSTTNGVTHDRYTYCAPPTALPASHIVAYGNPQWSAFAPPFACPNYPGDFTVRALDGSHSNLFTGVPGTSPGTSLLGGTACDIPAGTIICVTVSAADRDAFLQAASVTPNDTGAYVDWLYKLRFVYCGAGGLDDDGVPLLQ